MATMADVARAAGVSRSTVSYVLSGDRPISGETRDRVLRAMEQLDYTPNILAQGLAGRRTGVLALIHPTGASGINLTEFAYINAAAEQARNEGYHLLLWPFSIEAIEDVRKAVNQGLIDGALVMEVTKDDPRVAYLKAAGIPFGMIGRTADPEGLDFVDTDFEAAAGIAIDHLAGLGHTNLAFLNKGQNHVDQGHGPAVRVRDAVVAAAKDRHLTLRELAADEESFPAGWSAFEDLLASAPEVTAVLCLNEPGVLGFMAAAAKYHVAVPQDLSVVALLSSEGAAHLSRPALTTVSPDHQQMARHAVSRLIQRLQGKGGAPLQELACPELLDRGSTGSVRSTSVVSQ